MLRKYSSFRNLSDNIKLGMITAFSAGMVNVLSVILFFSFTSNVTGHYAILAQEIAKGNWYQAAVVFTWICAFFMGSFVSNLSIIHSYSNIGRYLAHAIPLILEIICLSFTGIYLHFFYLETLQETEMLVGIMLFAMGLQNGLTASISNFAVKTTHLTGLTTDLGLLFSMFTKKEFRSDQQLLDKAKLLLSILGAYMTGGIISGIAYDKIAHNTLFLISGLLCLIIFYDFYNLNRLKHNRRSRMKTMYPGNV